MAKVDPGNLEQPEHPETDDSLIGKGVPAYCKSCKSNEDHMILETKGDKATKVKCYTCEEEHAFKAPKKISDTPKGGAPVTELEWEKIMNVHKDAPLKTYSMKEKFLLGDKLNHASFGEGIVSKNIHPNKIEVIFKEQAKILIHCGS